MTTDKWLRVRELFEQALEREPADAARWLEQEASDPEIRREVASLLAHHTETGSFIAEPLSARAPDLFLDEQALVPGTTIGSYTIVREIGRGGMGRVYLASDARLGRSVALKALPPTLTTDPTQRERLRREARAAAALTHPGICTVYALEEVDGALFIAAEYVDGRTLREEMASGRRPSTRDIVDTARDLAAALASAHAKGVTHRDLKPENVMRTADGRLKILDFGLAQIDDVLQPTLNARVTQPGTVIGTPAYMAPEQLTGEPADARSDVFAFGVLMYEYACGVHPFDAQTSLALMARVLEGDAAPVESRCPDLPAPLASAIERCLRKRPAERFASGVDLALALARADDAQPKARGIAAWWRAHQLVVIALYATASVLAWQIKEWVHGLADPAFLVIGAAAAIGGVLRGHLIFTERINRPAFASERTRTAPITMGVDLGMSATLALDGVLLTATRPLASVLTIALAAGMVLTRTIVEPATTAGAFENRGR